jgi:SAM-dependent methyltransferase
MGRTAGRALTAVEYNEQWSRLGDFIRYNPGARHRRRLILSLVRNLPVKRVLDVGCGPGELLISLSRERPELELVGADLSDEVVESNRHALPQCRFEVLDLFKGHLDEQFDLVLSSEVIEHLDDWRVGVAHLAAMVAPAGYLCLTVPTGRVYPTERAFGHVEHPTAAEFRRVVAECGLQRLHLDNWGYPTYRALKALTNVRPQLAMRQFGSASYGIPQKAVSSMLYAMCFATRRNSPRGCQIFALFQASG